MLSKTYTDWDTRNGEVSHTVSLLVTPAVVVGNATIVVLYLQHSLRLKVDDTLVVTLWKGFS